MDYTKFIIPAKLDNNDENHKKGNISFQTRDLIFIDDYNNLNTLSDDERIVYPTDYAIMNGGELSEGDIGLKDRQSCFTWTRDSFVPFDKEKQIRIINPNGFVTCARPTNKSVCLRPALHLDISSVVSERSKSADAFKIWKMMANDVVMYRTIDFGKFPQTYVGDEKNSELEKLYKLNTLTHTDKKYLGRIIYENQFVYNPEYIYEGEKYVRVDVRVDVCRQFVNRSDRLSTGKELTASDTYLWVKVEPISWKIRNWDELPKELNPNGKGTADYIDVVTDDAIMSGVPFYAKSSRNNTLWQNSTLRGYLNSMNVNNITINGNISYTASGGGDFSQKGFLCEALGLNDTKKLQKNKDSSSEMSRLTKMNPDKTPLELRQKMTTTEVIKSWIDDGQSVLLRGPSGIGKTERIKTLYPDLIYIKLTNNMFPEKVVGSMNLQTGESIPPDFAKQAILACATEEEKKLIKENIQNLYDLADTIYERSKNSKKKTVILLDELLNVKPAVQSLVYTLVLNKFIEIGKGLKLPANTVVVATGNQKKYSKVAEDLVEPLEKRFDHILDMEPNVEEWIQEYAIPNKIHPAVTGYILSNYREYGKGREKKNIRYFYEEPEVGEENLDKNGCRGKTNDPRGWVSISNMLYAFENNLKSGKYVGKDVENLLKISIKSKLREEWAEDFFDYYNHPTITVEEIVDNNYNSSMLPQTVNDKFASVYALLSAEENQVIACRKFIHKHCGAEYLKVYDIYWAGNNEKRIEKIAELQELSANQVEDKEVNVR